MAFRRLNLSKAPRERAKWIPNRAKWLNDTEMARLVASYGAGATVYELAVEFGVHRTIISQRLKGAGFQMRLQPLTPDQVADGMRLYASGLSLAEVGRGLGVNASTIYKALVERGAEMRRPWDHPKKAPQSGAT